MYLCLTIKQIGGHFLKKKILWKISYKFYLFVNLKNGKQLQVHSNKNKITLKKSVFH